MTGRKKVFAANTEILLFVSAYFKALQSQIYLLSVEKG